MKLSIMTAFAGSIWAKTSACRLIQGRGRITARPNGGQQTPNFAPNYRVSMKPTLQFRLSQHLTLTPQLQQSIRLLQLSTVELNQEIEKMLMENPVLEREDAEDGLTPSTTYSSQDPLVPGTTEAPAAPASESQDAGPDEGHPDFSKTPRTGSDDDEDGDRAFVAPETVSLRQHLNDQLSLTNLPQRDRALIGMLIDAVDDHGAASRLPDQADEWGRRLRGGALHARADPRLAIADQGPAGHARRVHLPISQASNCRCRCCFSPLPAHSTPRWRSRVWGRVCVGGPSPR